MSEQLFGASEEYSGKNLALQFPGPGPPNSTAQGLNLPGACYS